MCVLLSIRWARPSDMYPYPLGMKHNRVDTPAGLYLQATLHSSIMSLMRVLMLGPRSWPQNEISESLVPYWDGSV
jgi:hypothetical protein